MKSETPKTLKTFYQYWLNNEQGFSNLGTFTALLMVLYREADNNNRTKLEAAFPEYFTKKF
jgi:hypothetical protein